MYRQGSPGALTDALAANVLAIGLNLDVVNHLAHPLDAPSYLGSSLTESLTLDYPGQMNGPEGGLYANPCQGRSLVGGKLGLYGRGNGSIVARIASVPRVWNSV